MGHRVVLLNRRKVTIEESESLSDSIDLRGYRVLGVLYPSGWDAAATTFQASLDDDTFADVYDGEGNELTIPSRTGAAYVGLNATQQLTLFGGVYLKVRSGTSGSPVAQGDEVELVLTVEPL